MPYRPIQRSLRSMQGKRRHLAVSTCTEVVNEPGQANIPDVQFRAEKTLLALARGGQLRIPRAVPRPTSNWRSLPP